MLETEEQTERTSDASLVAAALNGDRQAMDTLVRRYLRGAYSVALAILRSPASAEDVAQDAFVLAISRLRTCQNPERFSSWLFTIVRNQARNVLTSASHRRGAFLEDMPGETSSPDRSPSALAQDHELGARIVEAMQMVSERQREVVLLHDLEGWRHKEIAEALGISVVLSRQELFVARKALRKELSEAEVAT